MGVKRGKGEAGQGMIDSFIVVLLFPFSPFLLFSFHKFLATTPPKPPYVF
jgi:hypothetical protein